jgi:hypothetical protein
MFLNSYACNGTIITSQGKKVHFLWYHNQRLLDQAKIFYFLKDVMNTEMELIKTDYNK